MTKAELIDAIVEKTGESKAQTERTIKAFTEVVTDALAKKDSVQLVGFGTFETVERKERAGQNPSTGEKITIPATTAPKFKAGKKLKDAVK